MRVEHSQLINVSARCETESWKGLREQCERDKNSLTVESEHSDWQAQSKNLSRILSLGHGKSVSQSDSL